jgi:NAD(P)-dependent dehydrogenase (short-subunit alcohol dehydrogenase family)
MAAGVDHVTRQGWLGAPGEEGRDSLARSRRAGGAASAESDIGTSLQTGAAHGNARNTRAGLRPVAAVPQLRACDDAPVSAEERIAVVTGGNRGIGREVARQLAQRGFSVILGSRDPVAGERAAAQLAGDGLAVRAHRLDVTDTATVEALAWELADRYGRLDVLVNNAAIHYDTWQRASTADLSIVAEAWDTNLMGPWRMCLALLPLLRRGEHRRIVNVSSESGSLAGMGAGTPAYSVTKAALNALTRILAAELRSDGILVNAVCPGWVATDMGGLGGRPVADGAASVLWAVDQPDDGPTGGFFRDGQPLPW